MEEKKEIKVKNLFFASQIVDITLENIKNSKRSKINLNELEKKVRKERNSRFQKSHKILYIYIYIKETFLNFKVFRDTRKIVIKL